MLFGLLMISLQGLVFYRILRNMGPQTSGARREEKKLALEHGNVVTPQELHGHGKLYFVPVGRQAIPAESLADYYRKKFEMEITVLPPVKLEPSACVPARHQCIAEEVMGAMANASPEIARNPESAMIALTDEDIFPRELGWNFTYSLHSARIGVVSSRRMDPAVWGDPPNETVRPANMRQMLTKYIAMEYFHLADSFDPSSVLFTPLIPDGGPDDISESDLHPEESAFGLRGKPFPCLYFAYSYKRHEIKPEEPVLSDCEYRNPAASIDDEIFETNLGWGHITERAVEKSPQDFRAAAFSS